MPLVTTAFLANRVNQVAFEQQQIHFRAAYRGMNNAETHKISSTTPGYYTAMSTTRNLCLMDCPIYYSESLVMLGLEDMKEHLSAVPPASTYLTYLILLSLQKMI